MSQADPDQNKSTDKKEIAEEEREKMLNAENTKHTGAAPAPDLESEEQKPRKKIPIGGIKMPGFCRTKSKELCKDENETKPESTGVESASITVKEKEQNNEPSAEKSAAMTTKNRKDERKGIFNAIRIPLSSVFFKKRKETDADLRQHGTAGLASIETLDDSTNERNPIVNDDGLETVRLDIDADADHAEPPAQHPLIVFVSAVKKYRHWLVGIVILLLCITLIACVIPKGRSIIQHHLKSGKYIETVTSCGLVQGVLEDGGFAYRGIPYALPPVDNMRWKPAQLVHRIEYCWNGTYLAHNSSETCWQREPSGFVHGNEDCLYLDVFTPVRCDFPLPVVVMIGSETLSGGSPGIMQPSAKLSRVRDMIFVRPNFRLGIFGFLAVEPITRASHPPTSGNYGLSDIIAALQWVQLNIENFGGNKSSVILWGHRAGATLVTTLVGTRRAKNLFSRVWISSGSAIFPGKELTQSHEFNKNFLDSVRCRNMACLQSKRAEDLMDAVPETWHMSNMGLPETKEAIPINKEERHEWLVLDGALLMEHVGHNWARNDHLVKMVIGTTAHSGTPSQYLSPNVTLNATQIESIVHNSLLGTQGLADEALSRYNTTLKGLITMISDIRVVCPLLTLARIKSNIPFYVATQPRRHLADPDSDAAAILGSFAAVTPPEKRHVTAMQQLFNYYVWHGEVPQADRSGAKRVLIVGQDTLLENDYPNCDFWIKNNIVPSYGRVD